MGSWRSLDFHLDSGFADVLDEGSVLHVGGFAVFVEPACHGVAHPGGIQVAVFEGGDVFKECFGGLVMIGLVGGKAWDFVVSYQVFFARKVKIEVSFNFLK